jgi:hypothetical protein
MRVLEVYWLRALNLVCEGSGFKLHIMKLNYTTPRLNNVFSHLVVLFYLHIIYDYDVRDTTFYRPNLSNLSRAT